MDIRILGAHSVESTGTGFTCILVDDVLALEAGSLTSRLSLAEQGKLQAIVLTHQHYDHIRDIPAIGMSFFHMGKSLDVYAPAPARDALFSYLINDVIFPDYTQKPSEKPSLRLHLLEPGKKKMIAGYEVLPIPVIHAVPAVGLQITSPDGKKVFYTSDTGPGLADAWRRISPDVLLIELTLPNANESFALETGHMTPALLQKELESFKSIKGYFPEIVLVHLDPFIETQMKTEIVPVEKALGIKITFSYEGMVVKV